LKAISERWPQRMRATEALKDDPTAEPRTATLAQIYDEHFDFVWRNARRLGVPAASVDDVVQDVFVVVHRRLGDYDGRAKLRAWIFGILVRVVRDHRRSFRRKGARCASFEPESTHARVAIAHDPIPSELAERAERMRLMEMLLAQLDEDKRMLLVLSVLEQWTLREIGEFLGINIHTIHSRLQVAKRAFEQIYTRWLGEQGDAP
jgi:RNA polymerase sigma-70 factor (ECF subfamily)